MNCPFALCADNESFSILLYWDFTPHSLCDMKIGRLRYRKIESIFYIMDTLYEVLKWGLIVLIAGFIGQFGRTLSHHSL